MCREWCTDVSTAVFHVDRVGFMIQSQTTFRLKKDLISMLYLVDPAQISANVISDHLRLHPVVYCWLKARKQN